MDCVAISSTKMCVVFHVIICFACDLVAMYECTLLEIYYTQFWEVRAECSTGMNSSKKNLLMCVAFALFNGPFCAVGLPPSASIQLL